MSYIEKIIAEAIACCNAGFEVFPVDYKTKKPSYDKELNFTNGFYSATNDVTKIITFVKKHGPCNLAIATKDKLLVDIDPKYGGDKTLADLIKQHGALPPTPTAKTGSGGNHLYFKKPSIEIGCWANNKTGIDTKTDGGYVVVPPSIHENGNAYEWIADHETPLAECPSWLLNFIVQNHPKKTKTTTNTKASDNHSTFTFGGDDNDNGRDDVPSPLRADGIGADFTFTDDVDLFTADGADDGERNKMLCRLVGKHLARKDHYATIRNVVLYWASKCRPPLNEDEQKEALRSFENLYAKEHAKDDDANADEEDEEEQELSDEAYHGVVGDYVHAIEPHTEADSSAILVSALIAIGNVIGNKPYFVTDGDKQHTNVFGVFVGESANARKGVSLKSALGILDDDFKAKNIVTGLSSGEGLINAVRDEVVKLDIKTGKIEIVIEGVTDKLLLVTETELAQTLRVVKREGNTLSPMVRNAFDGMTLSALTKHRQTATHPHVSILAHITEKELQKTLSENDAFNGIANRFLWLSSKRRKYLPDGGDNVDVEPYRVKIRKAIAFAQSVGEMKRSEDARALWRELYVNNLNSCHPILSRASAITLRLSMIFALLDEADVIEAVHLRAAYAIWRYAEQSVKGIFGSGDAKEDAFEKKVYEMVKDHEGISNKELYDKFQRNVKMNRILDALNRLKTKGKVCDRKDTVVVGRPACRWYERRNVGTPETSETLEPLTTSDVSGVLGVATSPSSSNASDVSDVSGVPALTPTETEEKENCQTYTDIFQRNGKDELLDEATFYAELRALKPQGH